MAATVGTGVAITFQSSLLAEPLNVAWTGISRPSIDTTSHATTSARTFSPGDLVDWGELEVELNFVPGTTIATAIASAAETVTVTFPDTGTATWACSGFMTGFEIQAPVEDRLTATATIKFTGAPTITP